MGCKCRETLGEFFFCCNHGHVALLKFKYDHLLIRFLLDKFLCFKNFHFKILENNKGNFTISKFEFSIRIVFEKLSNLFKRNQETLKSVKKLTKKLYTYDSL